MSVRPKLSKTSQERNQSPTCTWTAEKLQLPTDNKSTFTLQIVFWKIQYSELVVGCSVPLAYVPACFEPSPSSVIPRWSLELRFSLLNNCRRCVCVRNDLVFRRETFFDVDLPSLSKRSLPDRAQLRLPQAEMTSLWWTSIQHNDTHCIPNDCAPRERLTRIHVLSKARTRSFTCNSSCLWLNCRLKWIWFEIALMCWAAIKSNNGGMDTNSYPSQSFWRLSIDFRLVCPISRTIVSNPWISHCAEPNPSIGDRWKVSLPLNSCYKAGATVCVSHSIN